ncbi:hypothetical protein [Marinicella gelatinilytica]|uniref:hypothetical protein n=1 Tax=Marinicella gelatinilytica TaxID=2996017 RepID=UPI002260A3DA|nr:hypothetical protein [Marinicella gelatinilytica]MCX7545038.1 hypothetical protein [Marinicella gelatinilytica]
MYKKVLFLSSLWISSSVLAFDEVEVTPANPQGWEAVNVRDDAMVEINKDQPLFGDGSLMFFTDVQTSGQDKADYHLLWQQSDVVIDYPQRTLGNVSALNYAWYRDSISTTTAHFSPVFRLYFYDDAGTADLLDDTAGFLIWEGIYNSYASPLEDSWYLLDLYNDNFWVYVTLSPQGSGAVQNYNSTLNDWINNNPQGQPEDPQVNLTANTYITGVNIGVGSGWGNSFLGYADTVRVAFGTNDDTLFNFEVCQTFVPNNNPDVLFDNSFECFK